jgi:uncharacterized membrane protein
MFVGKGGYAVQREFEEYAKALAETSRKQQQAEEVAEKKAEEERERRFQKKIAIAQVLVPLITFILGVLAEHFSGIAEIVLRILHK